MAQATHNYSLKLVFSDTDPNVNIPLLTAEQVSKMPTTFLNFLNQKGQVSDGGDLKYIVISNADYHFLLKTSIKFYLGGKLDPGRIQVRDINDKQMLYKQDIHSQDITYRATPATHRLFINLVRLYQFCLEIRMEDFRLYLCEMICTQFPVYAAEIHVLLDRLHQSPDTRQSTDPRLLKYLCQRIVLLRDTLSESIHMLPLLRSKTGTKDRCLSIVPFLDEASLEHILTDCQVDEPTEIGALLDSFVAVHSSNAATTLLASVVGEHDSHATPVQSDRSVRSTRTSQSDQPALAGLPFPPLRRDTQKEPVQTVQTHHDADNIIMNISSRNARTSSNNDPARSSISSNATQGQKRVRSPAPLAARAGPATAPTERRPFNNGMYKPEVPIKPSAEGEYWSVSLKNWRRMSVDRQDTYHRAGLICQTTAGKVAEEPCSECKKHGVTCMVFVDEMELVDPRYTRSCAMCIIQYPRCSANTRVREA